MLFNRKITLYLSDEGVTIDEIADAAVWNGAGNYLLEEEIGRFERACQCESCLDEEAQDRFVDDADEVQA